MRRLFTAMMVFGLVGCQDSPRSSRDGGEEEHDGASTIELDGGPDASEPLGAIGGLGPYMPQVVRANPEGVIASPKVVAVTYDNDPSRTDIETFLPQYAQSSAWTAQTGQYGIGTFAVGAPRHLSGNAPSLTRDSDIRDLLRTNLANAGAAWGAPDTNTIYEFFFPLGALVDDGSGEKCCDSYDGYHSDVLVTGVPVPYAIVCMCSGFGGPGITNLQELTTTASHEILEAVTDAYSGTPGYEYTDNAHAVWSYVGQGELADLCELTDNEYVMPSDMSYMIQRTWSNVAAAAGHDPCIPQPMTPYYQTVAMQPDTASIYNSGLSTKAVHIAVGASKMIDLRVFADAASGPYKVTLEDYSSEWLGGQKLLEFVTPLGSFMPGDTFQAKATVLDQDSDLGDAEAFVVKTTPVNGNGPSTYYFALVVQ